MACQYNVVFSHSLYHVSIVKELSRGLYTLQTSSMIAISVTALDAMHPFKTLTFKLSCQLQRQSLDEEQRMNRVFVVMGFSSHLLHRRRLKAALAVITFCVNLRRKRESN